MSDSIKLGIVQMQASDEVEQNLSQCRNLIQKIEMQGGADLICFPENAFFMRIDNSSQLKTFDLSESIFNELAVYAQKHQTNFLIGSVPLLKNNKVFNSSIWIDESGGVKSVYDKIHLFDVDVAGQKAIRESDQFSHGHSPFVKSFKGWEIGLSICYDLRFAELFHFYGKQEVDLILVPSAFLVPTGKAHWHTLLKARAIENQCFIVAPAQVGPNKGQSGAHRMTYGHSLAVDPWGLIIGEVEDEQQDAIIVELQKNKIQNARAQIPMSKHRRFHADS